MKERLSKVLTVLLIGLYGTVRESGSGRGSVQDDQGRTQRDARQSTLTIL
jgi:hypothetical protein